MYVAPKSRNDKSRRAHDDFEAGGNYHLILLAMNQEGYRNLCRLVTLGYKEGFYYKPRIDKELLRELNGGLIALSGCLASEVNQAIAARQHRPRPRRPGGVPRHLRGPLLHRDPGQSPAEQEKANVELIRLAQRARPAAGRHQRLPLPRAGGRRGARGAALHPDRQDLQRREALALRNRPALRQRRRRHARALSPTAPRRSTTRWTSPSAATLELTFGKYQFPVFTTPEGERSRTISSATRTRASKRGWPSCARRTIGRDETRAEVPAAASTRARSHQEHGLRRLLPHRRRLHQLRQASGHPRGPGPRLRRRQPGGLRPGHHRPRPAAVQPALRTLPQPGTQVDARHRHGFLLRAARRGDPLRAREVRRGPRRADHHLRHAEGEAGDQGRRARARVLLRRDRPHRQALSGAQAGQGLPARARRWRWSRACASCATRATREQQLFDHAARLEGLLRHASKHAAGIVIGSRPLVENLPLFVDKDGDGHDPVRRTPTSTPSA